MSPKNFSRRYSASSRSTQPRESSRASRSTMCARGGPPRRRGTGHRAPRTRRRCHRRRTRCWPDPFVGIDFDEGEYLGVERVGPLSLASQTSTTEDDAVPADRDDVDVTLSTRHQRCPQIVAISAFLRVEPRRPTTRRRSSPESPRPASPPWRPSRGPRTRPDALVYLACRVFQPWRRPISSSNLASAVSMSCSSKSSQPLNSSPSTVKADR